MKHYFLAVVACVALAGLDASPVFAASAAGRESPVSAEQAIQAARKHLKERKIDLSKHYLDSIKLDLNPRGDRGPRWILVWELSAYAKGGQIIARVSMDRTVEVGYGE